MTKRKKDKNSNSKIQYKKQKEYRIVCSNHIKNDAFLDFTKPMITPKNAENYMQMVDSNDLTLDQLDSRFTDINRVPNVASATCQG